MDTQTKDQKIQTIYFVNKVFLFYHSLDRNVYFLRQRTKDKHG